MTVVLSQKFLMIETNSYRSTRTSVSDVGMLNWRCYCPGLLLGCSRGGFCNMVKFSTCLPYANQVIPTVGAKRGHHSLISPLSARIGFIEGHMMDRVSCVVVSALKDEGNCLPCSQELGVMPFSSEADGHREAGAHMDGKMNSDTLVSFAEEEELSSLGWTETSGGNGSYHGDPPSKVLNRSDKEIDNEKSSGLLKLAKDMFMLKTSSYSEIDYLGESTKGDLNVRRDFIEGFGSVEEVAKAEAKEAEMLLDELQIPGWFPYGLTQRGIFCSRTLNLRSISTIGYDMDYTLIHYNVNAWEGRAYEYGMDNLRSMGYLVDGLKFDPELVIRGLIMDKEKGNLVKADRFGHVKRAMHGTNMLSNRAIREMYGREFVDLRNENRWEFLNSSFSISEAVMYMQMVERLDDGALPPDVEPLDYQGIYKVVAKALFRAHVE
eukprot:c27694_g1_i1 orf=1-1302(-)